jgi:hypothetical protein
MFRIVIVILMNYRYKSMQRKSTYDTCKNGVQVRDNLFMEFKGRMLQFTLSFLQYL